MPEFACEQVIKKQGLKALTVVKPISLVKQLSAGQLNKSSWTVKWSETLSGRHFKLPSDSEEKSPKHN